MRFNLMRLDINGRDFKTSFNIGANEIYLRNKSRERNNCVVFNCLFNKIPKPRNRTETGVIFLDIPKRSDARPRKRNVYFNA